MGSVLDILDKWVFFFSPNEWYTTDGLGVEVNLGFPLSCVDYTHTNWGLPIHKRRCLECRAVNLTLIACISGWMILLYFLANFFRYILYLHDEHYTSNSQLRMCVHSVTPALSATCALPACTKEIIPR